MRQIKRNVQRGLHDPDKDDPFDLFISSTNIRWCYYKETHRILGQTFGMCVLQDFEALTPNLLARTVETVEGGGLVVLLLQSVTSLRQLYTMAMDVHARFRTEAHGDVLARFNERFILSLADCRTCLVLDDELNVLPISTKSRALVAGPGVDQGAIGAAEAALSDLKESVAEMQPLGALVSLARTVDQAKAVISFLEAVQDKALRTTVSLTASRGRGKSAAVGLCLAGAVAFGYSNIFVTAPSPENLETVFDFVKRGLVALKYQEHLDFEVVQAGHHRQGPQGGLDARATVRISVFRQHRQVIQYIAPHEHEKLSQAELVAVDEAAAIPLPLVKRLLGPYLVFLSSTVTGYEGTGRSLSLKLVAQLREQQGRAMAGMRKLKEVTLETPIRYAAGDPIERWLYAVLCLDAQISKHRIVSSLPPASACQLYQVDRDALFSYHKVSEAFLQRVMALYTAAHYKNQPNDLQLLSDAPAHRLFVLLGPPGSSSSPDALPDVLCVIQVALEGRISQASVQASLARGHRASGDLIPWTMSQQFQDADFAKLSGARVVRIATHPDAQRLGYGTRALTLLLEHYAGKVSPARLWQWNQLRDERLRPRQELPPLLVPLDKLKGRERLHWVGSSFGLTESLLNFWARAGMRLVYLRQTANDLTGEHTAIMLRALSTEGLEGEAVAGDWLAAFAEDTLRRLVSLLSFEFREQLGTALDLAILNNVREGLAPPGPPITAKQLGYLLIPRDLERLHLYARNLADYHLITDLLPTLARVYFLRMLPASVHLSRLMEAILVGLGLRHRTVDQLARELGIEGDQILALFNKIVRKIGASMKEIGGQQEVAGVSAVSGKGMTHGPSKAPKKDQASVESRKNKGAAELNGSHAEKKRKLLEEERGEPPALLSIDPAQERSRDKEKKKKKKDTTAVHAQTKSPSVEHDVISAVEFKKGTSPVVSPKKKDKKQKKHKKDSD
ncbi:N-acetyltransferase 10 [Nannochloropsis gaditana CCMP526]|uniref:N-acetyltransferase 10 n=1 Tax=Nannochloropsis gaditana (strain CCMP526) TaxID=1093141 RepID=UPI00029F5BE7|nr:N-acetyltransferase 10 [Nannochloropsis gaditana CCMP526]EKU20259.1 N-acetyltransferase 10 [Nannochloropsis gaditana CCMP526]|eukprot:XP_005856123.1 N-acetyltransferase 10 [Nannochloropsis gaditana CCMP526]